MLQGDDEALTKSPLHSHNNQQFDYVNIQREAQLKDSVYFLRVNPPLMLSMWLQVGISSGALMHLWPTS